MKAKRSRRGGKPYRPTARDIRRACARIQDSWSETERRKRAGFPEQDPWMPPVACADFLDEEEFVSGW